MASPPTVLVTGANGFIASHIVFYLLSSNYKVIGTVREKNSDKNKHLFDLLPSQNHLLSLKIADLNDELVWDKIIDGCDYVIHTASPFPLINPKNPEEIIEPVVKGVRLIMTACIKHKIKKIIYTSSLLTVFGGLNKKSKIYNENDWCDSSKVSAYDQSKFFGEKEAWKIINDCKEIQKPILTVLLPGIKNSHFLIFLNFLFF